jgi:hypothetical protein
VAEVDRNDRRVTSPEPEGGGGLPRVVETPHRLELIGPMIRDEGAEDAPRSDGTELVRVADQDKLRLRLLNDRDQLCEVVASGHARLVEDHDASMIKTNR